MTTVYVLSQGERGEGSSVLGVFTTLELAKKEADRHSSTLGPWDEWSEWDGEGCEREVGCDCQRIAEWPVQEVLPTYYRIVTIREGKRVVLYPGPYTLDDALYVCRSWTNRYTNVKDYPMPEELP